MGVFVLALAVARVGMGQVATTEPTVPHRIHLILEDGSYQIVTSYRVQGANVFYLSAERGGVEEVIPLKLVDLPATHQWEQQHIPGSHPEAAPKIDPDLLKEEADRAAMTPEIAPDLSLPEQDSVLALDMFRGTPELVPLVQTAGELNRSTSHNLVKAMINAHASAHQIVELKGYRSEAQMHIEQPVFYVRMGDDAPTGGGGTFTVDTQGATGNAPTASAGGASTSRYVVVRADVRTDSRLLASFNLQGLGSRRQEDVVEMVAETLPGGHWMKLTPKESLPFGEYALMEVVNDREVNTAVWDFGVHPVAAENRDAIKPQPKRPFRLDHRPVE